MITRATPMKRMKRSVSRNLAAFSKKVRLNASLALLKPSPKTTEKTHEMGG